MCRAPTPLPRSFPETRCQKVQTVSRPEVFRTTVLIATSSSPGRPTTWSRLDVLVGGAFPTGLPYTFGLPKERKVKNF